MNRMVDKNNNNVEMCCDQSLTDDPDGETHTDPVLRRSSESSGTSGTSSLVNDEGFGSRNVSPLSGKKRQEDVGRVGKLAADRDRNPECKKLPKSPDQAESSSSPFDMKIDFRPILLTFAAILVRLQDTSLPQNVVFDELNYIKFVNNYIHSTFFFDNEPPLGKLILTLIAYRQNYTGNFDPKEIGEPIPSSVPIREMRNMPCVVGILTVPIIYYLMTMIGTSKSIASLAAFFVLIDPAFLTQYRFFTPEPFFLMASLLAFLFTLKHVQLNQARRAGCAGSGHKIVFRWFGWSLLAAIFMSMSLLIKNFGAYTVFFCSAMMVVSFYRDRVGDKSTKGWRICIEGAVQTAMVGYVTGLVYLYVINVNLMLLPIAGVHDSLISKEFQVSLHGGRQSLLDAQPEFVAHGSQISLLTTMADKPKCWLHSHEATFPIKYADGRGSSHQQQVTCYQSTDLNNLWFVKLPDIESPKVTDPPMYIKNGDVIQLVHSLSMRALNSHDVAAPMTPHNQEVSCYIDYNISMAAQNLWRVELLNADPDDDKWSIRNGKNVRLIHNDTGAALKFASRVLPDWGYNQYEITADKKGVRDDTVWTVDDHFFINEITDEEIELYGLTKAVSNHKFVPPESFKLEIPAMTGELIRTMIISMRDKVKNHNYRSHPSEWPLIGRGVAYFIAEDSNAQVYLAGNWNLWLPATCLVLVHFALSFVYCLRRHLGCYDIPEELYQGYMSKAWLLTSLYLINYLPYYIVDRTLFLLHYLPAYVYKLMLVAIVIGHLDDLAKSVFQFRPWMMKIIRHAFKIWIFGIILTTLLLLPFCLGRDKLSPQQIQERQLWPHWEMITHVDENGNKIESMFQNNEETLGYYVDFQTLNLRMFENTQRVHAEHVAKAEAEVERIKANAISDEDGTVEALGEAYAEFPDDNELPDEVEGVANEETGESDNDQNHVKFERSRRQADWFDA